MTTRIVLMVMALMLAGCFGMKPVASTGPATVTDPTATIAKPNATIAELRAAIATAEKEMADLKLKLKQAVGEKIRREFIIASIGFGALGVLFGAAAWFLPLFRGIALKAVAFCGVASAGCAFAARMVPYRNWVVAGVIVGAVVWAAVYFLRHAKQVHDFIVTER
jgi:hypothetical protein